MLGSIGTATVDGGLVLSPAEADWLRELMSRVVLIRDEHVISSFELQCAEPYLDPVIETKREMSRRTIGGAMTDYLSYDAEIPPFGGVRLGAELYVLAGGFPPPPRKPSPLLGEFEAWLSRELVKLLEAPPPPYELLSFYVPEADDDAVEG